MTLDHQAQGLGGEDREQLGWRDVREIGGGGATPTLPVARAVITEVLTVHFFAMHPHYLDTMIKFRDFHLRI